MDNNNLSEEPPVSGIDSKYYFYDDAKLIVYISDTFLEDQNLIYLGISDNPNRTMAAGYYFRTGKVKSGFKIVELP